MSFGLCGLNEAVDGLDEAVGNLGIEPSQNTVAVPLDGARDFLDRLEPIKKVARTVKRHRDGILRWFDSKIANGLIEAINSLVQAAKAKAHGYRSLRNLIAITYLIAGKIDLKLAT